MRNKYASCSLDYDLIRERHPNMDEYEEIVNAYLDDEFFTQLEGMLEEEDYAMAKDAVKGLYILAGELCLFPLYERLLEVYEDLEYEMYGDVMAHCREVTDYHARLRGIFRA